VTVSMVDLYPAIKEGLENNQIVEIKIRGNSMRPFLKDQKTSVGLQTFSGQLEKNRIYLYQINDKYILHRYLKSTNDKLVFRGDALYSYEYPNRSDIIAKVIYTRNSERKSNPYSFWNRIRFFIRMQIKNLKMFLRRILRKSNG